MFRYVIYGCALLAALSGLSGCVPNPGREPDQGGPSPARKPNEERASFRLQPGLDIQLVAAEPMVQDPVVITFDPDGRLWVVEMRGFMTDIEGKGEKEPTGRVSVLEDTDGDGRMDASTVYLDSLVMPRALALVPGGALVAHNGSLWLTQDRDGDLRADTKTLLDSTYAGSALPEHAGNGLWRGLDNWYYNAKSRLRYRLAGGKWQRDSTEFRGQWGISHDDRGRLVYNYNWSQLHADLVPPNYLSRNRNHTPTSGIDHGLTVDRRIYPIRSNPAVNRGYIPGTLDSAGRLLEFTAACSPLSYRGTALPKEYYGNVFVCEPSGNLVKRNVVTEDGLLLAARDPNPGTEFLASTDERFRPVHLASGPDGALYVADMYRGLVQHGAYITPYLREQTLNRKLVLPVHRGRIWRVVPQGWKPSKPKKLSGAPSSELVGYLSHPDGWYRDVAQRLLVERNDPAAVPALRGVAATGKNSLARVHALWTLEGIKGLSPDLLISLVADRDPMVRTAALRLLEPFAAADEKVRTQLGWVLLGECEEAPPAQILQMALSAAVLEPARAHRLLAIIAKNHGSSPLVRDAILSSLGGGEFAFLQSLWRAPDWQLHDPSREILLEMLAMSTVRKGDPSELSALLALLDPGENEPNWRQQAVLTGLATAGGSRAPIRLPAVPALFTRTHGKVEASRLAAVASLFEWPGHRVALSSAPKKYALNEEDGKRFALGRQHYLTTCAGCHGTDGTGVTRFAPPLAGSDWVLGDEKRLALIVLHGMEGPVLVGGKKYDAPDILPVMPAHSTMDDAAITAILTYIRNAWGNDAGPVAPRTVGMTRVTSQGRVVPWKAEELNSYVTQTQKK
jgi:mono/diheme cytochrome c family protein/glucose/arabinose dehydrogenase